MAAGDRMSAPRPEVEGFEDLKMLGSGASAIVYRARETSTDVEVALKVFTDAVDDEAAVRFEDACEVLAGVSRHPNICTLRWFGHSVGDQPYLAMDLCAESLGRRVRERGVVSTDDVVPLLRRMSAALLHAHGAGLVHGDIKPENLLLTTMGEPVLTDFALPGEPAVPRTNAAGTVTAAAVHAAPEVLAGGAPTPASDVWSLASTAHHLLSGSAPFRKVTDESSATLLARIQRDPTPNLHDHGVPTWLCRVLDAAMAKDPADRPSVRRFLLSLDTHGAALDDPDADSLAFDDEGPVPEVAAPPGFKDPFANLPKKYRRHRRLRRVLLGLAVVAVIGGAAALALLL